MKKIAVLFVVGMCTSFIFFSASNSHTNSTGAPSGFSGSVSDGQNNCSSCHISTVQNLPSNSQVIISSELENGDQYTLGASYYISITASSSGINKFGFQACMENTAGEKVYPEEVEEAVKRNPNIFDCLVVGLKDDRFGQRVVALASFQDENQIEEQDLIAFTREHLAGYKLPKQVLFVPEVMRAPNGKANYKWAKETAEKELG